MKTVLRRYCFVGRAVVKISSENFSKNKVPRTSVVSNIRIRNDGTLFTLTCLHAISKNSILKHAYNNKSNVLQ